ncbi:MAG: hypothetical protein P4L43_01665 [Syntrophobacteraceae bacterium]|nr:hypothetical protein [Syntrophobacteraceae bacterium]
MKNIPPFEASRLVTAKLETEGPPWRQEQVGPAGNHAPDYFDFHATIFQTLANTLRSKFLFWMGVMRYASSFMNPFWLAFNNFTDMEMMRLDRPFSLRHANDLIDLLLFEIHLASRGTMASISALNDYQTKELREVLSAAGNSLPDSILRYSERQLKIMDALYYAYPRAVRDIEPEYGLHLDNGGYTKTAETERFELYQALPTQDGVATRDGGKPMIIIPPYVLGANILAFLPGGNRSYVHAFANHGIPTYIRVIKDIGKTEAVQSMTGEDDALDLRYFSEVVSKRHGKPVTLNGYCQGGFMAVIDVLSGQLNGLVDALITSVAPLDGSRGKSMVDYIEHLPFRFRDLGYALKTLPNGKRVVDGRILSWVFKLKSIENEAPFLSFYRDLMMFDQGGAKSPGLSKVAAAISHWLTYDITDLPIEITRLSFDSWTKPVSKEGTLPVRLFGKPLNFTHMAQLGIKWLICVAQNDDLVDLPTALAPLTFTDAEVAVFPKGHASIATSWSSPAAACSLETVNMEECGIKPQFRLKSLAAKSRGPIRFHLDLEEVEKEQKAPPPTSEGGKKLKQSSQPLSKS